MKRKLAVGLILISLFSGCSKPGFFPSKPGNFFIHQKFKDLSEWKTGFSAHHKDFKEHGFLAYSLHRDLLDPQKLILTLKSSNLKEGGNFLLNTFFNRPVEKSTWAVEFSPIITAGVDVTERQYENGRKFTIGSGIVIVRHQVKDFPLWLEGFKHTTGGTHHHPDRGYIPSNRSIHKVPGNPEAALVVHEASDVSKAPAFMNNPNMKDRMEAGGVIGTPEIWYGINLEEGSF